LGFNFHTSKEPHWPYWNEAAVYEFTAAEIERIEAAAIELHRLCLLAIEHLITQGALSRVGVFRQYHRLIVDSWRRGEPALLGRMDLSYDGSGEPKLLEYNADTPISLLESAVVQWHWLEETRPGWDQFNSAHERLIVRWREILPKNAYVHLICQTESDEDVAHVRYLLDTVLQAGYAGKVIDIRDVGLDRDQDMFMDRTGCPIEHAFKLYPWDWMFTDRFGPDLWSNRTRFIEPVWRTVLNSKGLLAVLWELFPGHPNLLPAHLSPKPFRGAPYVRKPMQSREGANVRIVGAANESSTEGPYGGPSIYQAYAPLFQSHGMHAQIGAWMVGDAPAGMSVREDLTAIIGGSSQFVPHAISPE
jgi:glutathionylspermidine synthase